MRQVRWIMAFAPLLVATADNDLPELAPGLWRNTLTIVGEKPLVTTECRAGHRLEIPGVGQGCRIIRQTVSGGIVNIARQCGGRTVTATGRYSPTILSLRTSGVEFAPGTPTTFRLEAQRVAECTPED